MVEFCQELLEEFGLDKKFFHWILFQVQKVQFGKFDSELKIRSFFPFHNEIVLKTINTDSDRGYFYTLPTFTQCYEQE